MQRGMMKLKPIIVATLVAGVFQLHAATFVKAGDVVAICGDSITYQRAYSVMIEDYLLMCRPVEGVRVAQFGSAGETSAGCSQHMAKDVLRFKPTVLLTLFGMNDGRYLPFDEPHANDYRKGHASIIAQAKQAGVRTIVLGSPTCVDAAKYHTDTSSADVYNAALKKYGEIGCEIAKQNKTNGVVFADVNARFMDVMTQGKATHPSFIMSGDGVHPLNNGHLTTAYMFLKALGCDGNIGTITVDLSKRVATGTPGQKIIAMKDGTVTVESTRYPFCFWGNTNDWNTTVSVLPFLPFNRELNRYLLVVKGLPAPKAKVTWGTQSKTFVSAALAKGINLADEFIDNPFVEPFRKVDKAVLAQQDQEDFLLHGLLFRLEDAKRNIPGEEATFDRLIEKGIARNAELSQAAAALVIPVKHIIQIESVP